MNCAHEPQDVACSTASQAWNIAESREVPVPRPPLLMHAASPTVPTAVRAPAKTRAGRIRRLKLRIALRFPPKKRQRARDIARDRCRCTLVSPALLRGKPLIVRVPWLTGDGTRSPRATCAAASARRLQVYGLGPLAALVRLGLEGNAHPLVESADVRALDGSDMNEDVLASLVRRDEAEPFRLIEELYSSGLPHARSPCPR